MGFANVTVVQMLQHLKDQGGDIDCIDIQEIKAERDAPWDTNQHIVTYFLQVDKAIKRLDHAGVKTDDKELISSALYQIKQSGEMEHALKKWDNKDAADKT